MHKSIFTFILLVSSLGMLSAMPLFNQNNGFSNIAMAQGYDDNYNQIPAGKIYKQFGPIVNYNVTLEGYDGNYNQIPAGKIYKQFGPIVNSNVTLEGLGANSTATCLTGDTVLNGGYRINSTSLIGTSVSTPLNFTLIETEPTSTADGWTTEAITAGSPFTVQSIAQCFDNPPAHIP